MDVGKPRHKKMCRDQNCVATTGAFGQNVPTFGCRGDISPTCPPIFSAQDAAISPDEVTVANSDADVCQFVLENGIVLLAKSAMMDNFPACGARATLLQAQQQ